jgi:hypothetical protein
MRKWSFIRCVKHFCSFFIAFLIPGIVEHMKTVLKMSRLNWDFFGTKNWNSFECLETKKKFRSARYLKTRLITFNMSLCVFWNASWKKVFVHIGVILQDRDARWYICKPNNPIWVNFLRLWIEHFGIFWSFSIFYDPVVHILYCHLVYFVDIWYIFPILVCCTEKNLATLLQDTSCQFPITVVE